MLRGVKVWGLAALAVVCLSWLQVGVAKPKRGDAVSVKRQIEPRYPAWAYNEGISKGFAKVAFYVDEQGEISELMPIEYSYEAFAKELMAAVVKWEFRPARKNGQPVKSVCHAYWEFLPDRPIETNALFDTSRRIEKMGKGEYRELKYREDKELDSRIGMVAFPGVVLQIGDASVEPGLEKVRARVSFFVNERGEVALPQVVNSSYPALDTRLEAALKRAHFAAPSYEGKATLALLERTYDFPVVWTEEAVPESL